MKKLLLLISFLFLTFQAEYFSQSPTVQSVINETNIDSLIFFVQELSGEVQTIIGGTPYTIVSRHKNQPSNDKSADYIQQKLESYGLPVTNQWFSSSGRNVFAVQTGTEYPNQKYIICAHYDDMPSGSIAPGADDNASGTAAVLEAARIISQYPSNYSIVYALWDEEEQGLIGSAYYAALAAAAGDSILGVVNLDMIAWDSDNNDIADLHTRSVGTSLYLKDKMIEVNNLYSLGLNIDVKNPGSTYSDHASFWYNGYGAILLIEDGSDFNNYYHTVNDKVIHFNSAYYLKMSKAALGTIATLAQVTDVVPVELASFSGSFLNSKILLEWTTASELNNLGFEVERSFDSESFVTIGFVEGQGTSAETNYYSFVDKNQFTNHHLFYYRLKQVDLDGNFSYSNVIEIEASFAKDYALKQNYPNPFNPTTNIEYSLPQSGYVDLRVYNLIGETVAILASEFMHAGNHKVGFNASGIPSGLYFYTIKSGEYTETKKMLLTK